MLRESLETLNQVILRSKIPGVSISTFRFAFCFSRETLMPEDTLFYEDDYIKICGRPAVGANAGEFWVTFAWFNKEPFAKEILDSRPCGIAYIITLQKNWYQYALMPAILKTVRKMANGAPINIYGISMGGFASLLFSGALDAERVLTCSPQVFLNRGKAFEQHRFQAHWDALAEKNQLYWPNATEHMTRRGKIYVVFDPYDPNDRRHIMPLANYSNVVLLPMPFAHHGVLVAITELKLFKPLLEAILADRPDQLDDVRRVYMARRREASSYYLALARRPYTHKNYESCKALLEKLFAITPKSPQPMAYRWLDECRAALGEIDAAASLREDSAASLLG